MMKKWMIWGAIIVLVFIVAAIILNVSADTKTLNTPDKVAGMKVMQAVSIA